jgi:hypothetical protein
MKDVIQLGELRLSVIRKDIKNIHLSVHPPDGRVSVAAPEHLSLDTIRIFTLNKLAWIRSQQKKFQSQPREAPREYLERESHYLWGKRLLLKIVEKEAPPQVTLSTRHLILQIRPSSSTVKREQILAAWYREQLRQAVPALISHWETRLGVKVNRFFLQHMKTKWGSCNYREGNIRLNTELVKKPAECLRYLILHEMAHLLEPNHSERFIAILDRHYPTWREVRSSLQQLPLSAESWQEMGSSKHDI